MREGTPDLDEQLDRLESVCPAFLAKPIHFVRKPHHRWLRIIAGILFVIGGLLSFLPVLGIEMLPIGLMLIAIDVPVLRPPIARMIAWCEEKVLTVLRWVLTLGEHVRAGWRAR
jgi:hypothetical protein